MSWAVRGESGNPALLRAALFVALHGGRVLAPLLLWPATVWFLLLCRPARAASRDYLGRVLDRPPGLPDVVRHFHGFAVAVLDRVLLLAGRTEGFAIQVEGLEHVLSLLAQGRGCILLGAHLGSFEVLRTVAARAPVPVWALMYRRNAGALTALLDRLAPGVAERILPIGDTASMIRARECVERGEMVGILADRAPPGHRTVPVPFLGGTAPFPAGPFILAATLAAPVVMFHAVRTGRRRYAVRFAPFAPRVILRRAHREADLRAVVAAYAARLELLCRAHPLQWFNFFPFWQQPAEPAHAPEPAPHPAPFRSAPAAVPAAGVLARGRGG